MTRWKIESGRPDELADIEAFLATLDEPDGPAARLFDAASPVVVARAPGRLDLMGGIADYSGSLTLEMPIAEAAIVAAQPAPGPVARVVSIGRDGAPDREAELSMAELREPPATVRDRFTGESAWAAYVLGTITVLAADHGFSSDVGVHLLVDSAVPEGKGVSSSAAIEVATMTAVIAAFEIELDPARLALACQRVENRVVGAPCGAMDQMTSCLGEAHRLLRLRCRPAEPLGHAPLPEGLGVWGIDSGLRHAVSGADYGTVRVAAFMGHRMIAEQLGGRPRSDGDGAVIIENDPLGGWLTELEPSDFTGDLADGLPGSITGETFLKQFGGTIDPVTTIDPAATYPVRAATGHPVFEHFRVRAFDRLLTHAGVDTGPLLGELMRQSHLSYSACGLGSAGTDRLVELVREEPELFGAKITGGGSGGTVAVLGRAGADAAVARVAARYRDETGHAAPVMSGSSPGAAAFGVLWLAGH